MRAVLFCKNPYAFSILTPLYEAMCNRGDAAIWYVPASLLAKFPLAGEAPWTSSIGDLVSFRPDALFVPGNEVPHYLRGVKVQVFHGLAGEKKGHFRVRHYFDLYLTQGPYFTTRFEEFARKCRNFKVVETGWPKLDPLFRGNLNKDKERLLPFGHLQSAPVLLYAPTFSPSLTSGPAMLEPLRKVAQTMDLKILVKFHDLMDEEVKFKYEVMAQNLSNVILVKEPDIVPFLVVADVLLSDTSSVVHEFLLLDKPALTFRTRTAHPAWQDFRDPGRLPAVLESALKDDPCQANRLEIIRQYHPWSDGRSAERVLEATDDYIQEFGVPERRRPGLIRRMKMNRMFGKNPAKK